MIVNGDSFASVALQRRYDVAIVGGGTVGLFLAADLKRRGKSVIIVEMGGASANTSLNAQTATSVGHPHFGTDIGRASGVGGTSALWAGQLAEFDAADLQQSDRGWPVAHSELRKWYDRTYEALGVPPRPSVRDYQEALGFRIDADAEIEPLFTRWLTEPNFARSFARDIRGEMPVVTGVEIERFTFSDGRAEAMHGRTEGGRGFRVVADRFVLAAGTIGNARLALAMQRVEGCPWRDNALVGAYFQDHLGGPVASVEVLDDRNFRRAFEHGTAFGQKFEPKLKFTDTTARAEGLGISGAFLFRSSLDEHLSNLKQTFRAARNGVIHSELRALPRDIVRIGGSFLPLVRHYLSNRRILAFYDQGVDFFVLAEQIPLRESRIRLSDAPTAGLPQAEVDWRIDGREVASIRRFVAAASRRLESHGLARLVPSPDLADQGRAIALLEDTYHQCGGLRMSGAPDRGVTDPDSRIWNTENVYVAGASTFPTASHANTTLTALALATRLAEHMTLQDDRLQVRVDQRAVEPARPSKVPTLDPVARTGPAGVRN